jgi:adenylate cyclase
MAPEVTPSTLPSCVHRTVSYLRDNLHQSISLGDLIGAAVAPERTLHRQFRQALGMTPWAYLRILRLAAARRALSSPSDHSITSIALNVGYNHFSRFARDYRKHFGELPSTTRRRAAQATKQPCPPIDLPTRSRPCLWVTPFHANAGHERQLAESIADHLASELSRSGIATVIVHRPSVLHRPIVDQSYSLLGRLTRAANELRLTLRLVNDVTGHHVWAGTFDGEVDAPFALQDRVADAVIAEIAPALTSDEIDRLMHRPIASLAARQIALRSLPLALAADPDSARGLLAATDQALDTDPADTLSLSLAALGHAQIANLLSTTSPAEHRERASQLLRQTAAAHDHDALSLTGLAWAASALGCRAEDVERLTIRALAIDPTLGWAWSRMGFVRLSLGQKPSRALADFRRAARFNGPKMPRTAILNGFSRVALAAGSRPDNIAYSLRALEANPSAAWIQVNLICAYQAAGEWVSMRQSMKQLRAACPDLTVSLFSDCRPYLPAQCLQIMRDAGLPLN